MLQLTKVDVGYATKKILSDLDIEIKKGDIHVLIGLNGSGKTSLLKTIFGLLKPLSGRIEIEGRGLETYSLTERASKISYLESHNQVVFPMTIRELLKVSLRLHGRSEIYAAALRALDLEDLEEANLQELSSGETKRAFLAHALCSNSKIIIMDEPLAHLDWKHQAHLVASLKNWRERFGTTFVLAIHELEWIPRIADQVTALGQGRIISNGSAQDVFISREVSEVFAFRAHIDENPIDGTQRLTLGTKGNEK